MNLDLPTRAIMSLAYHTETDALKRFTLFNGDVEGAGLSFRLFNELRAVCNHPSHCAAIMYHGSCFVCAVRRAGRLLESLSANRNCFHASVAKVVCRTWKQKRAFFQSFAKPRNAIEHTDGKAGDGTKWSFFNLEKDRFCVIDGVSVDINQASLESIRSARDAIAEAVVEEYRNAMIEQ